jgi:hypothetical protein
MKNKNIIKLIIVVILILSFISCNYGSVDGHELTGKWESNTNEYTEYISFSGDGSGYYIKYYSNSSWSSKDFTYSVSRGKDYMILKLVGQYEKQYEYYFNNNSCMKLYLRCVGTVIFQEFNLYSFY